MVGGEIAVDNMQQVSMFFNEKTQEIIKDPTAASKDLEYYKSSFKTVKEEKDSAARYAETIEAEGATLLKNQKKDGSKPLPLSEGANVSLFSASSVNPVISGSGAGGSSGGAISLLQGLTEAGLEVNQELYYWYEDNRGTYARRNVNGAGGVNPDMDQEFNASNGYFVVGMYAEGATLTFEINSDQAVNDAKVVMRLSTEDPAGLLNGGGENPKSFSITNETFQVKVNGQALAYEKITFNNIKSTNKFKDYTVGTNVSLIEGKNTIELVTNNDVSLGGTTEATAPIVDNIKIITTAKLTWDPLLSNIE